MAWLENGVCYAIQQEAIDAHFDAIPPTVLTSATTSAIFEFIKLPTGLWNMRHSTHSATGVVTQQYSVAAPIPFQASCLVPNDPTANFLTGVELGTAVMVAMVSVFVIRRSYRGF